MLDEQHHYLHHDDILSVMLEQCHGLQSFLPCLCACMSEAVSLQGHRKLFLSGGGDVDYLLLAKFTEFIINDSKFKHFHSPIINLCYNVKVQFICFRSINKEGEQII